jgi:hypothetical protein
MNAPPVELVALAALLLVNRMVIPSQALRGAVFWPIQVADAAAALYVVFVGLPDLDRFPVVGWMVAGLLVFHIAQNLSIRSRKQHDIDMREADRERVRARAALRSADSGEAEG